MALDISLRGSIAVGRARTIRVEVALGLAALASVVVAVSYYAQVTLVERVASGVREAPEVYAANDTRVQALNMAALAIRFTAMVLLLHWIHRAVRNASQLSFDLRLPTPAGAVWGFFIPFANFVLPVQYMRALHRAVDPERLPPAVVVVDDPHAGYRSPARRFEVQRWRPIDGPIVLWWVFWLLPLSQSLFVAQIHPGASLETLLSASWGLMAFEGVRILSALFGLLVVRAIDARTTELARRREALPDDWAPAGEESTSGAV